MTDAVANRVTPRVPGAVQREAVRRRPGTQRAPDDARTPAMNDRPAASPPHLALAVARGFDDYALLDSGNGRKLERFGAVTVDRPEPQAMWAPRLPADEWARAAGVFAGDAEGEEGRWRLAGSPPASWPMRIKGVTATCRFGNFRHVGVFPEQLPLWEWMLDKLAQAHVPAKWPPVRGQGHAPTNESGGEPPRLLNLFAYTGVASLLAAAAGAQVTHVDASKRAIDWAKENQAASGLDGAPIRWMLDDARKFAAREVRRGRTYHGILVDPPKFGRGPNKEVWEIFDHLPDLLRTVAQLLDPAHAFLILTVYAIRASSVSIDLLAREVLAGRGGTFESGEVAIAEAGGSRLLSTSLFTKWCSDPP
jgi:23S rRNA (cytosine1962-C5)-methyltransferase